MDTELNNQEVQNEQFNAPNENEGQSTAQPVPAPAEPEDLAAAFAALRDADNGTAQTPVGAGETKQPEQRQPLTGTASFANGGNQSASVQQQQPGTTGATSIDLSGFDASARAKEAYTGIRQQVIQEKSKEWQEKGYKKFSVRDLARRDEQTGRIFYVDPNDRPEDWERPGYKGMTIEQAKAWCDITNDDLNNLWKQECQQLEQQYVQQYMPYFQLLAYANTYSSLNPTEQYYVNTMTEPYAIRDEQGNTWGFNCDLNQITQLARQMAREMGGGQAVTQQQNNVRTPATDARSGAGGNRAAKEREPKDLNDAFEILWERDKQGGR